MDQAVPQCSRFPTGILHVLQRQIHAFTLQFPTPARPGIPQSALSDCLCANVDIYMHSSPLI